MTALSKPIPSKATFHWNQQFGPPTHEWIPHPEHAAIGWLKPAGRVGTWTKTEGDAP